MASVCVVGGGIFGVTAACELRRRGHSVTLCDPGPIPHRLAESTDISKVVRLDYGDDEAYTALMERALARWRSWHLASLFHETGVLYLCESAFEPGGFEHDSYELLSRRGHRLERLDRASIRQRFPAWNADVYSDGYFNPQGGWAESGRLVAFLAGEARDLGVQIALGVTVAAFAGTDSRVTGIVTTTGETLSFELVVLTAGSWIGHLLPSLREHFHSVGQPVFHLAPADTSRFDAPSFPVWCADIARTGYYGFPSNADGLVKIANHGVGRAMHPESLDRVVSEAETAALRVFASRSLPALAITRIASTRVCVYGDTKDQHFWIAPDPERRGLVVAGGGSGHAFKFAPLLGEMIANAVDGDVIDRFRWRPELGPMRGAERARHQR